MTDARHYGRFVVSGLVAFGVHVASLELLVRLFGLSPLTAAPLAIGLAVVASWLMQRTLTFRMEAPPSFQEFGAFLLASAASALTNYLTFALVLKFWPDVPLWLAVAIACGPAMVVGYVGMRFGAFRVRPTESPISVASFLTRFFLSWSAFAFLNRYPGYVHFDAAEVFSWASLGFSMGYAKHPPLLPWMVATVDAVIPVSWVGLVLLGVVNVTVAAFLVWRLATMCLGEKRAPLVLAMFMLSAYTVWHGIKLNHNTILLSIWPATVLAYLALLRDPRWWRGIVLGIAAAAAIYAKYSSVLLLIAIGVATLSSREGRALLLKAAPYVAAVTFVAFMTPHILWEWQHGFTNYRNADNPLAEVGAMPARLIGENLLRSLPVFGVFLLFMRWIGRAIPPQCHHYRELLAITLVPVVLTIGVSMGLGLRGSHSWLTPIYCFLPLVLAAHIQQPANVQLLSLNRAFSIAFLAIPVVGAAAGFLDFRKNDLKTTEPIPEIVRAGAGIWHRATNGDVPVVTGDHAYAVGSTLALDPRPKAWSHFSTAWWWIEPEDIRRDGALVFCRTHSASCNRYAQEMMTQHDGWTCEITMARSRFGMTAKPYTVRAYFLPGTATGVTNRDCTIPQHKD